jgi:hypothetical protein
MLNVNLTIEEEIQIFITPLTINEKSQLEQNLKKEGCREALIIWLKSKKEKVLIDGHHRYAICKANNIPYDLIELTFNNIEEVKDWMIDNQLGRRNLNPEQLSYYRGVKYNRLKQKKGGYDKILSKGQNGHLTSRVLADNYKVSERTIRRDAQFAHGLQIIDQSNSSLKDAILRGDTKINKSIIMDLANIQDTSNLTFKNEADFCNKVENIKRENSAIRQKAAEDEIEMRLERANKILDEIDPVFQSREERINKIKGNILSVMNKAIKFRKRELILELIELIKNLEDLIVDDE